METDFNAALIINQLHRDFLIAIESRAQNFVTRNQLIQRGLQRVHVERAIEFDRQRNVVQSAVRFQLIQQPKALLRKRKGNDFRRDAGLAQLFLQ